MKREVPIEASVYRREVESRLDAVRAKHGPWTAHNIKLLDGLYTIGPDASTSDIQRGDYFAGVCMSVLGRSLHGLKVLDLGCLEGGLSIQFARLGAHVDGLDIRADSIAKARIAAELLKLESARFFEGDVLDLPNNTSLRPSYDVILCAGLLYHLDAQDHLLFMRSLARICTSLALIDTHISLDGPDEYQTAEGLVMRGRFIKEGGESYADRMSAMWSGWSNNRSFWPTEPSLLNALHCAGFAFVAAARQPVFRWPWRDRSTWLAFRGHNGEAILSSGPIAEVDERTATHPSVAAGRNIGVSF
jgi:2-polyprenyl-3-methyl-5-hydroxy-6-metoxy-1,4-benzoquinol methylase